MTELRLFNSLTRQLETFKPVHEGEARVYSCGPTVYNYPHIGNMRAYVFADTLGRVLSYKGYKLTHVINITDVGHLTDDADAGEDKMEKMAAEKAQSIYDIARHYTKAYWQDIKALNIRQPAHWSIATDYVPQMIEFAKDIADKHCYKLDSGLYFDVSTVADYGRLAREDDLIAAVQKIAYKRNQFVHQRDPRIALETLRESASEFLLTLRQFHARKALPKYAELITIWSFPSDSPGQVFLADFQWAVDQTKLHLSKSRIDPLDGKRNDEDFAIWRKTPKGETRQMEWDSPWGKGAPGWHLECSVMSGALLGFPFDIHTGGIDHREIHHPNEIAQNQAHCCTNGLDVSANSGANIWMHNNFLVERSGKMSKSSGEFLRLATLKYRGFHPWSYRMMCLQAHFQSELEFSWDGVEAAQSRLKRLLMQTTKLASRFEAEYPEKIRLPYKRYSLKTALEKSNHPKITDYMLRFNEAISDNLNTPRALVILEDFLREKRLPIDEHIRQVRSMLFVLGLGLRDLTVFRRRPARAKITLSEIESILADRRKAREVMDFETSDRLRDHLASRGVEVMDGDPLGWDWKLDI